LKLLVLKYISTFNNIFDKKCLGLSHVRSLSTTFFDAQTLLYEHLTSPLPRLAICLKAASDRSRILPATNGPRSLIRTTTVFPFSLLVTLTRVPNGRVLWAAVKAFLLNFSPLAVGKPWASLPYHEHIPSPTASWTEQSSSNSVKNHKAFILQSFIRAGSWTSYHK